MLVSTTELQNNFGKYLRLCEQHNIVVTKNGKKRALLLPLPKGEHGYEVASPVPEYGANLPAGFQRRDFVSYQAFLKMSKNSEKHYEYIDGEVYLLASPGVTHQRVLGDLFLLFRTFFTSGCEVFVAPFDIQLYRQPIKDERKLTDNDINVVQPDLVVLCDQHESTDEQDRYKGTPALVVEILSPATRSKDMISKLSLYSESGIGEYWIVDPKARTIMVYSFAECAMQSFVLYSEGQIAESGRFPGLRVALNQAFGQ